MPVTRESESPRQPASWLQRRQAKCPRTAALLPLENRGAFHFCLLYKPKSNIKYPAALLFSMQFWY